MTRVFFNLENLRYYTRSSRRRSVVVVSDCRHIDDNSNSAFEQLSCVGEAKGNEATHLLLLLKRRNSVRRCTVYSSTNYQGQATSPCTRAPFVQHEMSY